ncbi:unnamed protein product [Leptosia nina]|uniref:Secreted protein n=1 Tax=Leptosia nina TaxID=320188 RepID=A0AAV1JHZ2_9NEOP
MLPPEVCGCWFCCTLLCASSLVLTEFHMSNIFNIMGPPDRHNHNLSITQGTAHPFCSFDACDSDVVTELRGVTNVAHYRFSLDFFGVGFSRGVLTCTECSRDAFQHEWGPGGWGGVAARLRRIDPRGRYKLNGTFLSRCVWTWCSIRIAMNTALLCHSL